MNHDVHSAQSRRCQLYFHLHSEHVPLSRLEEQHRARLQQHSAFNGARASTTEARRSR